MQKEINKYLKQISAEKLKKNFKGCVELYNVIGGLYSEVSSYDEAVHYHEKALEICKTIGDRYGTAKTYRYIGEAKAELGNFYQALDCVKKYLELSQQLNNKVEIQRAWTTYGRIYLMQAQDFRDTGDGTGRVTSSLKKQISTAAREAERKFQTALDLANTVRDEVGDKEYAQMVSALLINLALIKDLCGQNQEAVIKFNRAIEMCKEAKLKDNLLRCQLILAANYRQQNNLKMAARLGEEALQTAKSIGKKLLICDALIELGLIRISQRDFKSAKKTFAQAYLEKSPNEAEHLKAIKYTKLAHLIATNHERISDAEKPSEGRWKTCDKLGDLFVAIGNYKLAVEFYRRAFADAKVCSRPKRELAKLLYSLAETYADDCQYQHALLCYEKELAYRDGDDSEQCKSLIKIAYMHEYLEHEPEKVAEIYERAYEKAGRDPKLMYGVLKDYVPYMKKHSYNPRRCRELEEIVLNLKSYPEIINEIETEDHEEIEDLDDEIENIDDIITDDEDDEVLMIGRRKARGAQKFKCNELGETPLHEACIRGDLKRVKSLIAQGHELNPKDHAGWLPLHECVNHGHYQIVEYLIERGADVNNRGPLGLSPLHDAATNGHFDIMRLLIKNGANVISLTDTGETVLSCLRDYRKRTYSSMSDAETSEYRQMEAELLNEMDRNGYNLMSENLKHLGSRGGAESSSSSCLKSTTNTKNITTATSMTKPTTKTTSRIEKPDISFTRNIANSDTAHRRPVETRCPPRLNKPLTDHQPIWLNDDDDDDDDVDDDNVGNNNHDREEVIELTSPVKEKASDDMDDSYQNIIPICSPELPPSAPSRSSSPCCMSSTPPLQSLSPPTKALKRKRLVEVSDLVSQPLAVMIDDTKLLVPIKDEYTTIGELKKSIVDRYSILVAGFKPIITLALQSDPECLLFDSDLCKDVVRESLIAKIKSWHLKSLEQQYVESCQKNSVEPENFIKIELRAIENDQSGGSCDKLNLSYMKFPRKHLEPIIEALARREFSCATFRGATCLFECHAIGKSLLETAVLTWNKLVRLNLDCCGLLRVHFELLCNSKSNSLPRLQSLDISHNSIAYKSAEVFGAEVELLRKVCPSLKQLNVRRNHLQFSQSIFVLVDIEVLADDQYDYSVYHMN